MGENTVAPHRAWPHETIDQAVRRRARDRPTEIAVVGPALTLTWQELDEAADRTADILDALGVRSIVLLYKGDLPVPSGHDTCDPESGPAAAVATRVSPKIDVIVTSD